MKVFVIVPAAGLGTRMAPPSAAKSKKKAPSKQFKELGGVPILVRTLRKFAATPAVYEIIVALRKDEIAGFCNQVEKQYPEILSKRLQMVEGGELAQRVDKNGHAAQFFELFGRRSFSGLFGRGGGRGRGHARA